MRRGLMHAIVECPPPPSFTSLRCRAIVFLCIVCPSVRPDLADSGSDSIFTPADLINDYFAYTTGVGALIHSGGGRVG